MNARSHAKGLIEPGNGRVRDEQELIARCVAGEAAAWNELHFLFRDVVLRFLSNMGIPRSDVEDARQEVFVQLHRTLATFRGDASLKTWIYRLCITQADRARRRSQSALRLALSISQQLSPDDGVVDLEPSHETAAKSVAVALARLNERDRRILVLHALEGRAGREICDLTGATPANVWRILHYARRDFIAALSISPFGSDEPLPSLEHEDCEQSNVA